MILTPSLRSLKKSSRNPWLFVSLALVLTAGEPWTQAAPPPSDAPVFLSDSPNPNDYVLFANGGWDGNWYVGYNTLWIKKLPPLPPGRYARVYLGAKLGRMKILDDNAKPWDKHAIPGSVYMAISSTMAWTSAETRHLVDTSDIPLECGTEEAIEGTGSAQWFWTEVPPDLLNHGSDHFAALWSTTPELVTVSSSPVLAAAWGGKEISAWLVHDLHGAPPSQPVGSAANGLSYFQPAIALKLVPEGPVHPIQIHIVSFAQGTPNHLRPVLNARIEGDSVESAWMEYSTSGNDWTRVGRRLWQAPYTFTIDQDGLPKGQLRLRVAAVNIWEEEYASPAFTVSVAVVPTKK